MDAEDHSQTNDQLISTLKQAHQGFLDLETVSVVDRNRGLLAMATALQESIPDILEANTLDLEISREMAIPDLISDWLKLTKDRCQITISILQRLSEVSDPIKRIVNAQYRINPSQTYCQFMPLGVVSLIYEGFPQLGAITAGICLKTGNSLVLRGGSETSNTNKTLVQVLKNALDDAGLPSSCLQFLSPDEGISSLDLIRQDQYLNLVIPYGRPSFVQNITLQATAPVLKTAMGNCYLYWSSQADCEMVKWIITDSHSSIPDPVNAIEKVIITPDHKPSTLIRLFNYLDEKGFRLRGDNKLVNLFPDHLTLATLQEWSEPYLDKRIAFKQVDNLDQGIAWINKYSSGHAECLVTESYSESRQFAMRIDSALVYINDSPRFARNPQRSDSIFLGVSNQKGYRRGLIGLETFTTVKQVVQGEGYL